MLKSICKISQTAGFLFLFLFSPADATELQSGERVDFNKMIPDDLYGAGEDVNVRGEVGGDANLAGGDIDVSSRIGGDLNVIGGKIQITSEVRDDIHVMFGEAVISGKVYGDIFALGGQLRIEKEARVLGAVYVTGGDLRIEGDVTGPVTVNGGMVYISGKTGGDLTVNAGETTLEGSVGGISKISSDKLALGKNARFSGNVKYWSGDDVDFSGALAPGVEAVFDPELEQAKKMPWAFGIFMVLAFFASIFLSIYVLNRFCASTLKAGSEYVRQNFVPAFGMGMLYILLTPALFMLLMVLVIPIPFGLLFCSVYFMSWIFAGPLISLLSAYWISEKSVTEWNPGRINLTAFGIHILLFFVWLFPFAGWLASLILTAAAFGAMIRVISEKMKQIKSVPKL